MADNNAVTKEDLKSALDEVVAKVTKLMQETAATTEARIMTEMDGRFEALRVKVGTHNDFSERRRESTAEKKTPATGNDQQDSLKPDTFLPSKSNQWTFEETEAYNDALLRRIKERHMKQLKWHEEFSRIAADDSTSLQEKIRLKQEMIVKMKEELLDTNMQ